MFEKSIDMPEHIEPSKPWPRPDRIVRGDMLEVCKHLESKGLPIPVCTCEACGKTMWKEGHWFQCPDCGALSTQYGGTFTHCKASDEWKKSCATAKEYIQSISLIKSY